MTPSLGAEGAFCDCSAPSNHECANKENVVGGRSHLQQRKVPTKSLSNDDRTAHPLGEVAPPSPGPPRNFLNTLLGPIVGSRVVSCYQKLR